MANQQLSQQNSGDETSVNVSRWINWSLRFQIHWAEQRILFPKRYKVAQSLLTISVGSLLRSSARIHQGERNTSRQSVLKPTQPHLRLVITHADNGRLAERDYFDRAEPTAKSFCVV
jgi:hypothetical protein